MKPIHTFFFGLSIILITACAEGESNGDSLPNTEVEQQLEKLSQVRAEAEKNDDLSGFLAYYDTRAISMPEYQPTLTGASEIEAFYREIFQRQEIITYESNIEEIIRLDSTLLEIGTFEKEYTSSEVDDTLFTQKGKYWHVWETQPDGNYQLKGEAFGFFHPIDKPEKLTVQSLEIQTSAGTPYSDQKIPFELKAYNALMEKGVRTRDGELRSEFFTPDGRFMPFQEPTVNGMDEIRPYLIAYSSRGNVTIDSIACDTYHYESFRDYLLEYAMFKVKWSVPDFSGRTEGKGIRIWKRQADGSLKLYREIGTHNHLE